MAIWTKHSYIYLPKHNQMQYLLNMLLACMCQQQICPLDVTWQYYSMCTYGTTMSVYITLWTTAIKKNVTGSTGMNTFHIIGICLWMNMPVTLYMYIPLHCYCNLYTESIYRLHINQMSVKKQQAAIFIYYISAIYVSTSSMFLKCHIHKLLHIHQWESMPICMPHMKSLASPIWPGALYTEVNSADDDNNANNHTNKNAARLQKLSWPLAKSAYKTAGRLWGQQ